MKKNVLVTGIGQSNYILQLYSKISPELIEYNFNTFNLKEFGNKDVKKNAESVFKNNYQYKPNLKNILIFLGAIPSVIFNNYFWKDLKICFAENGFKFFSVAFILILRHINAYYYAKYIDENTNTDIIHLHFPKHIFALFFKYLKKEYTFIITYWGSDIFRIDSWRDHEIQNSILKNAHFITSATQEMEFAILTRYGFHLKNKIRYARFIHDNTYYEIASKLNMDPDWIPEFKTSLNINKDKIVILFGHNAHWENNHRSFLECLNKLPNEVASSYHIIFPLTYGDKTGVYIEELREKVKYSHSTFTFLTDFLDWEDLAKLKIISNVYIHCPSTDGLSAFLTEFFYTNNLAIVGDWLPYKTFIDFDIKYLTFKNFNELENILMNLDQRIIDYKELISSNRKMVSENFAIDKISNQWVKIFKELN